MRETERRVCLEPLISAGFLAMFIVKWRLENKMDYMKNVK